MFTGRTDVEAGTPILWPPNVRTYLFEKTLMLGKIESRRRSNQSILKEISQPWVFFGRNDAEAETPVLFPPHAKSWLIGKDSDAGKDRRQKEKRAAEDKMVR